MKAIEFEAAQPASELEQDKLLRTLKAFEAVREKVMTLDKSSVFTREVQDDIADEVGTDRFMVEDVAKTLLGKRSPIDPEYLFKGFWTFGRHTPRFGTPWGTLVFYDNSKTIQLLVRYGGSFLDEEDPPLWVKCRILSTANASYDELEALARKYKSLDLWWYLKDGNVVGKLVFR